MFAVRLLSHAPEPDFRWPPDLRKLLHSKFSQAAALRQSIGLPSAETTAYRLVHSEGDRLSGLVVDIFGDLLVVQSSASWVEVHREVIEATLGDLYPEKTIVWQQSATRLRQDGWNDEDAEASADDATDDDTVPSDAEDEPSLGAEDELSPSAGNMWVQATGLETQVKELGLAYVIDAMGGQKTGFYCDQRDNRQMIRSLSPGREVLDLYSFSGGFGLNAAFAGAKHVTSVDSSIPALQQYLANAQANGFDAQLFLTSPSTADLSAPAGPFMALYKTDVVKFLRAAIDAGRTYDVVVCDPPKLCPQVAQLSRATRKYHQINTNAMRVVKPGGLLLSCTCSAAVASGEDTFLDILRNAASTAGRRITVLSVSAAAMDHPVYSEYPEGRYLRAVLMTVV
uniref:S-adenosylmethionine-dependent methyltransferase domain-containing protein n=1 Tax=Eutreptiella gymnastica TaxID=73025 RepID=A0A7S1NN15_9EUGL